MVVGTTCKLVGVVDDDMLKEGTMRLTSTTPPSSKVPRRDQETTWVFWGGLPLVQLLTLISHSSIEWNPPTCPSGQNDPPRYFS